MNKKQIIILSGSLVVVLGLIALIIVLISNNSHNASAADAERARADSLMLANDQLKLANEFDRLNSEFQQYEDQQIYLTNDSLVTQYNEARKKVESLLKDLNAEKRSNAQNRERIKQLEAEITTLKGIVRHYLEEIQRLGEENEGLKKEIQEVSSRNQELTSQVSTATSRNEELSKTVNLAKKLNITGLSLRAYNKKDKSEKNITKARKLGVSFTVSPNNTAAPGMKSFAVRIITPEGNLLPGGGSVSYEGASVPVSVTVSKEYANDELPVSIYYNVNSTLTPGDYTVEVFCDGYRLASRRINMTK